MSAFSRFTHPLDWHRIARPGETLLLCEDAVPLPGHGGRIDFEAIWSLVGGEVLKQKGERSVVRLSAGGGPGAVFYLKRHRQRLTWWQALGNFLNSGIRPAEGVREFLFYQRFRQNGLATAEPVAAGSRRRSFLRVDSFLMTRDYAPLTSLEELFLQRGDSLRGPERQLKREAILRAVARYAAAMHASGMNHQDFNATHILIDDPDAVAPRVALFDLQRVDVTRANRLRWPVKALAELCFTLPPDIFGPSDRLLLLRAYRGVDALSWRGQLQYRLIRRKASRIAAHTRKRGLAPKLTGGERQP